MARVPVVDLAVSMVARPGDCDGLLAGGGAAAHAHDPGKGRNGGQPTTGADANGDDLRCPVLSRTPCWRAPQRGLVGKSAPRYHRPAMDGQPPCQADGSAPANRGNSRLWNLV